MEAETEPPLEIIDTTREEGELSDDGEIIDLSDDVMVVGVERLPLGQAQQTSINQVKSKNDDPKQIRNENTSAKAPSSTKANVKKSRGKEKKKSPEKAAARYRSPRDGRTRRPIIPTKRRARSRSRSREKYSRNREPSRPSQSFSNFRDTRLDRSKALDKSRRNTSSGRLAVGGREPAKRPLPASSGKTNQTQIQRPTELGSLGSGFESSRCSSGTNGNPSPYDKLSTVPVHSGPDTRVIPDAGDKSAGSETVPGLHPPPVPLLDLIVHPPPPPPPLPPPLPSSPPPDAHPPPPPPPGPGGIPDMVKLSPKFRNNRRPRNPPRKPRIVPPRSPPGEVDNDYIDLLLEYKQIQKQLENIKKEEERAASGRTEKQNTEGNENAGVDPGARLDIGRPSGDSLTSTKGDVPPWRQNKQELGGMPDNRDVHGEEDDLDELELRLAALASAAKVNPRILEKSRSDRHWRPGSLQKKRPRSLSHRDSLGATGNVSKRRYIDDEPPWVRRDRLRRMEEERRREEEQRRREEEEEERRKEEERRREVQKILTLDNPAEQVERFLRLCKGSDDTRSPRYNRSERNNSSSRYSFFDIPYSAVGEDPHEKENIDDYEVKEMDLDSDISSPAIEVEQDFDLFPDDANSMDMVPEYDPQFASYMTSRNDMYLPARQLTQVPQVHNSMTEASDYFHPMEMTFMMPPPPPPDVEPSLSVPPVLDDCQTSTTSQPPPAPPLPGPPEMIPPDPPYPTHIQSFREPDAVTREDSEKGEVHSIEEVDFSEINDPLEVNLDDETESKGMTKKEGADEAEELRAVLLQSMRKRTEITTSEEGKSSGGSSPINFYTRNKSQVSKKKKAVIPIPRHQPVVISLGNSSESDDSEPEIDKLAPSNPPLLSSLDQFLKDARQLVEKKEQVKKGPVTPEALRNLPQEKINEYKKLKEEIKRREQNKGIQNTQPPALGGITKAASFPLITQPGKTQVPPTELKKGISRRVERLAKTGMKIQIGGGIRSVQPNNKVEKGTVGSKQRETKVLKEKANLNPEHRKQDSQPKENREPVGGMEKGDEEKTENDLREMEARLTSERVQLEEDESVLMTLRDQIKKRKLILKTAEAKAQQLREQLAAAERIVGANRQQVQKYISQARGIKLAVDERRLVVQQLEKTVLETGKEVLGEEYALQLQSIDKQPSPEGLKRIKQLSNTAPPNATINELAQEKQRLLQLEKLYAEKIRTLKGAQKEVGVGKRPTGESNTGTLRIEKTPQKIVTSETMNFASIADSDLVKQMVTVTPRRRRSLVEIQKNSPLPFQLTDPGFNDILDNKTKSESNENLPRTAENGEKTVQSPQPIDENNVTKVGAKTKELTDRLSASMNSSMRTKLVKLQNDNLVKFPTGGPMPSSSCDKNILSHWWPRNTPVPSKKLEVKAKMRFVNSRSSRYDRQLRPYSSVLRSFRSYRFNPYFRTKEKLRLHSLTVTHKINPLKEVCKYDIHGTCNDEKCPWQHEKNYVLTKREVLQDIASYCPEVANVTPDTLKKDIPNLIDSFVDSFCKQNEKMTHNEQTLLLASKVSETTKRAHPHHIMFESRAWYPNQQPSENNDAARSVVPQQMQLPSHNDMIQEPRDNVIVEGDVRYWMASSDVDLEDMETAVLDTPTNTHLWIKLAYKKLNDERCESKGIDKALNVFANALQANHTDSELWLHYLGIYSRRDNANDISSLCEQALKYAPSYALFWKYLGFVKSFSAKEKICARAQKWLCELSKSPCETRSHQLLEITLHLVSLNISTGRFKAGLQVIKTLVPRGEAESLHKYLQPADRCLAALGYIHLLEFKTLPPNLYDPSHSLQAPIVCKEIGEFGWREGKTPRIAVATLEALFRECEKNCLTSQLSPEESDAIAALIYPNWIFMLLCAKKYEQGVKLCQRILTKRPCDVKIILNHARFHSKIGDVAQAKSVLRKGIEDVPLSIEIFYTLATLDISLNEEDAAIEHLENAVIDFFDVEKANYQQCDPNLLYCRLLDQPVPLSFTAPPLKEGLLIDVINRQKKFMWLSYCLLLQLQGDTAQVPEAYEAAISSLHTSKDVQALWLSYLQYKHHQAMASNMGEEPALTARWHDLVRRCLISSPNAFPVPHRPNQTWLDFRFHNDVSDMVVRSAPKDQQMALYENHINLMSRNVQLICRACEDALRLGDRALARGITTLGLLDHPGSLQLWKVHLRLAQWNSTYWEVKRTFEKAVKIHPLSQHIWKDYILYELVHGTSESFEKILSDCQDLEVQITDYLSILTEPNKAEVGNNQKSK